MVNHPLSFVKGRLNRIFQRRRIFLLSTTYSFLSIFCLTVPLSAQNFEDLLKELSGSEADQLESEKGEEQKKSPASFSSTDVESSLEEDEFAPQENIKTNGVTLQGLDKTTARVFIIDASLGQTIEFGTLRIEVQHCEKAPLENRQESMAFVKITEAKPNCLPEKVFSGWMFSSSPALSSLDHPMYDVWIKECKELK